LYRLYNIKKYWAMDSVFAVIKYNLNLCIRLNPDARDSTCKILDTTTKPKTLILNVSLCFVLPWPKSESRFSPAWNSSWPSLGGRITIFQTQNPYVSGERKDFQFIASRELTLEAYDKIDSKALCELGLGEPGEKFWVRCVVLFVKKKKILATAYYYNRWSNTPSTTCFQIPYPNTGKASLITV